jgi:hypothetical protein
MFVDDLKGWDFNVLIFLLNTFNVLKDLLGVTFRNPTEPKAKLIFFLELV